MTQEIEELPDNTPNYLKEFSPQKMKVLQRDNWIEDYAKALELRAEGKLFKEEEDDMERCDMLLKRTS
jgi:hypothetical protein